MSPCPSSHSLLAETCFYQAIVTLWAPISVPSVSPHHMCYDICSGCILCAFSLSSLPSLTCTPQGVHIRVRGTSPCQPVLLPKTSLSAFVPRWRRISTSPFPASSPCMSKGARPPEQHTHPNTRTADPWGHVMVSYRLCISLELCLAFPVTRKPSWPKASQLFLGAGGFRDLTLAWLERSLLASARTLINNEKHLLYICM